MIPPFVGATSIDYYASETDITHEEHEKLVRFSSSAWQHVISHPICPMVYSSSEKNLEQKVIKKKTCKNITTLKEQIKYQESREKPFIEMNFTLEKIVEINNIISKTIKSTNEEFKAQLIELVRNDYLSGLFSRLDTVLKHNYRAAPCIIPIIDKLDEIKILFFEFNDTTVNKIQNVSLNTLEQLRKSLTYITTSVFNFIEKKTISNDSLVNKTVNDSSNKLAKKKKQDDIPVTKQIIENLVDCDKAVEELNLIILMINSMLNKKLHSFSTGLIKLIQVNCIQKLFMCLTRIKLKNKNKNAYISGILDLKIENFKLLEISCTQNINESIVKNIKSSGINELIFIKNQVYIITSRIVTLLSQQSCIRHRDIAFVSINSIALNTKITKEKKESLRKVDFSLEYINKTLNELNSSKSISQLLNMKIDDVLDNLHKIYTVVKDISSASNLRLGLIGELKLLHSSFDVEITNLSVIKQAVINSSEKTMKSFIENAIKIVAEIDFIVS